MAEDARKTASDVDALSRSLGVLHRQMRDLESSYSSGNLQVQRYREEKVRLEKQVASTHKQFSNLGIATKEVAHAANQSQSGLNNMGMRMLMIGQFADDMQYGLRGVINNVPQLAMAFGAGPGIAGAASVAAVGLNLAVNALEGWQRQASGAVTKTESLQREMAKFGEGSLTIGQSSQRNAMQQELNARAAGAQMAGEIGQMRDPFELEQGRKLKDQLPVLFGNDAKSIQDQMIASLATEKAKKDQGLKEITEDRFNLANLNPMDLLTGGPVGAASFINKKNIFDKAKETAIAKRYEALTKDATEEVGAAFGEMLKGNFEAAQDVVERLKKSGMGAYAEKLETLIKKIQDGLEDGVDSVGSEQMANRIKSQRKLAEDAGKARNERIIEAEKQAKEFAERQKEFAEQRMDRRADAAGDMVGAVGGDEMAANIMGRQVNNARFRRRIGAGTRAEALTEAAEMARAELARNAMMPERAGGLGLGRQAAEMFANESVNRAMIPMMENMKQAGMADPQTTQELAMSLQENSDIQREMVAQMKRGVGIRLGRRSAN